MKIKPDTKIEWSIDLKIELRKKLENIITDQRVMVMIEDVCLSLLSSQQDSFRRKVEGLERYVKHDDECILSYLSAGRPTKDGGYEQMYAGKWYQSKPIDKTPKCNCGLDEVLAKLKTI